MSISGDWIPWSSKVPQMEVETHKVASPDVVVPTLDTVRHEALLYTWLADHKPMGKAEIQQRVLLKTTSLNHLLVILFDNKINPKSVKI